MEGRAHSEDYRHAVSFFESSPQRFSLTYQSANKPGIYPAYVSQEPTTELSLTDSKEARLEQLTDWLRTFNISTRYITELINAIERTVKNSS